MFLNRSGWVVFLPDTCMPAMVRTSSKSAKTALLKTTHLQPCRAVAAHVRGILFDDVGSFGNNMLVSTNTGQIFSVTKQGVPTQIADLHFDSEGMAIGTSAFGPYAGYL